MVLPEGCKWYKGEVEKAGSNNEGEGARAEVVREGNRRLLLA